MRFEVFLSASLLALSLASMSAQAQVVQVKDGWVRSTVPSQTGSGAFMKLTSKEGMRLTGVSSPVAGVVEVHEMKMDGDVMRMRPVPELALPAGREVQLKPGGYHLMLMALKQPLVAGSEVPVTLLLKDGKGVETSQTLMLPVMLTAPGGPAGKSAKPANAPTPTAAADGHGAHKH